MLLLLSKNKIICYEYSCGHQTIILGLYIFQINDPLVHDYHEVRGHEKQGGEIEGEKEGESECEIEGPPQARVKVLKAAFGGATFRL